MIYTDFMNTKNVEQGSAATPSGHPGADYYQNFFCAVFICYMLYTVSDTKNDVFR